MDIMIIGAGAVGTNLAEELTRLGESIVIVEQDKELLASLDYIDCPKVQGVPIDMEVLEKAGVKTIDAVACVTESENMNVMLGQMLQKIYGLKNVIVHILNPENEGIYKSMGLKTISSTTSTIEMVLSRLGFSASTDTTSALGFPLVYKLRRVTDEWDGVAAKVLEKELSSRVLAVAEDNSLSLVSSDYILRENQEIILVSLPEEDEE